MKDSGNVPLGVLDGPAALAGADHDAALRTFLLAPPASNLIEAASAWTRKGHGPVQTYSPKVFIPLTQLCRNVCHYCTFAHPPRKGQRNYLLPEEVLEVASAGARAGCHEALFTLGDKPELRYAAARTELAVLGHETTIDYLEAMCVLVRDRTGLLPHVNAGVMNEEEMRRLRRVSASQGLMLEAVTARLCEKGGPHHGSPDKLPAARLKNIEMAGRLAVPFTSGILIGIGETREERLDALFALRALHRRHGHLQEIIVQNFRAKPGTRMARAPEPSLEELVWTIAAARLIFGPFMSIQAPPNLSPEDLPKLLGAGVNDWGGVSPVTPDHVNPEAPWPERDRLRAQTEAAGKVLVERLAVYPAYALEPARWQDPEMVTPILRRRDADGLARPDSWTVGGREPFAAPRPAPSADVRPAFSEALARLKAGEQPGMADLVALFSARGREFDLACAEADALRARTCGDEVTYVVTRNINYTNVCRYKCNFCAFSKGRGHSSLRGTPYDLDLSEVARRAAEAAARGASELCMQGGIHPSYTGDTYIELLRTARGAAPGLHVHAFSPLEVAYGAATLGLAAPAYLARLRGEGLGSLPGTAAEILDDEVRSLLCPDKLTTDSWLETVAAAHAVGLRSTATIMFGHLDAPVHWARHLLRIRALQARTGGFTEFVPLPFVHEEAPLYRRGEARRGPTAREAMLMHAVARLALHPLITNIQVSWVKLGADGAAACLRAGANDLGGTLMNESISAAAGARHGQEMSPAAMEELIRSLGRVPRQRTTLYGEVSEAQRALSLAADPVGALVLTPVRRRGATQSEMEMIA
ncbi:MAG: synthase [Sphingomonadales bacterium]|nr:synthase [Sphingomonadales bacterium]